MNMWIDPVMNLLFLLALGLLVMLSIVGIYAYLRDRKSWKWILAKASESDQPEEL